MLVPVDGDGIKPLHDNKSRTGLTSQICKKTNLSIKGILKIQYPPTNKLAKLISKVKTKMDSRKHFR